VAWPSTRLVGLLGIELPIVQAPMAGTTTPELVAAVSGAGALGSLGGSALEPEALQAGIRRVRELTERPFAVNLFAPHDRPEPPDETVAAVDGVLAPLRREIGLPEPSRARPITPPYEFERLLEVVVAERVPIFSFTFGIPPLDDLRGAGTRLLGTATSVAEAVALEQAGVDAVVAQGSEAGGHRGTFEGSFEDALVGTISLVPQIVDAVEAPVIAAGGIADGRGIAAALALGAAGAQLGTAFIPCPESGAPHGYKQAVLDGVETATTVTRAYTGRPARVLRTPLIDRLESAEIEFASFPAQGVLLQDFRSAAAELDRADLLLLLAGQSAGLTRALPAAELVTTLARETQEQLGRL
jgi:nitronate monooxygenase